ncbi:SufE family protein [Shewanella maritima]|uniref:SufE family protein n=1 Tax=Shewanella maritima TaxID=2520507 RepID=UPI0037366F30
MLKTVTPPATLFCDLADEIHQAVTLIEQAPNWQEKYRQIMLVGKKLPSLPTEFQLEQAQVKGCESQAWLYHHQHDKQHYFLASSDARIVKGLIALLLAATQGKTSEELGRFNIEQYFTQLGLDGQLSPSRTNGINALNQAIIDLSSAN